MMLHIMQSFLPCSVVIFLELKSILKSLQIMKNGKSMLQVPCSSADYAVWNVMFPRYLVFNRAYVLYMVSLQYVVKVMMANTVITEVFNLVLNSLCISFLSLPECGYAGCQSIRSSCTFWFTSSTPFWWVWTLFRTALQAGSVPRVALATEDSICDLIISIYLHFYERCHISFYNQKGKCFL